VALIFIDHADFHTSILVTGLVTVVAVGISMVSAFPWVRNTHHKQVDISTPTILHLTASPTAFLNGITASWDGGYFICVVERMHLTWMQRTALAFSMIHLIRTSWFDVD